MNVFVKKCPVCQEKFKTSVRHQKYCGKTCYLTHQYNEQNWHKTPVKRAPQWWLDRRLGGNKCGSQDDIYKEAFQITLKEEIEKLVKIGFKIDVSKVELVNIRPHSAQNNWGYCYYPRTRTTFVGGVMLPAGKYCFAFNRRLMSHTRFAYGQTVMHELIHVVAHQNYGRDGRGHGRVFKAIAAKVNAAYGYSISRCTPRSKFDEYDKAASGM